MQRAFWVLALIIHSSAGAVLVGLSAAERVQVWPILELVNAVDRLDKPTELQFSCAPKQISYKTVRRDPQGRVRLVAYRYNVPDAREERVRFFTTMNVESSNSRSITRTVSRFWAKLEWKCGKRIL